MVLLERVGSSYASGPLRRTDPNINVCMENSKTYRTYGWTIDHFFHCQGTTQTLYKQKCRWLIGGYPIGSFKFRATTIGEGAACLGRDAAKERHAAGEMFFHGTEEWLLQLWPR